MSPEERKKKRDAFLLKFYEACWNNISRAEEAAWKIFAAYIALFAGLSFLFDNIGVLGFLLLIIVFSSLATSIALNAHLWFLRNIGLISNFEREFLFDTDYGSIVDPKFKEKLSFISFESFEVWLVLIVSYLGICSIFIILFFNKLSTCNDKIMVMIVLFICCLLILIYSFLLKRRYDRFIENAPGPYGG